jgi:hypothetical protein
MGPSAPLGAGQTRLLARTFFARMFESDLMPEGFPQVQLMLWGTLLAATPTTGYPMLLRRSVFDSDRVILLTLTMVAIGVVALFIWDGVFPDRRDVRNLGSLPIPTRHFVLARLAALGQVFVLFATPVCVPQSIIFGLMAAASGDPLPRLYGISAHLVTVLLAATFVFCFLIAAQCLLLLVFGRRAAQAASMSFQVLFAVGLVQMLVFLGEIGRFLGPGRSGEGLAAAAALPPTWFLGFYRTLTGTGDAAAGELAKFAVAATVGSVLLAVGLYASTYSRLSRRALEGPARTGSRTRPLPIARIARSPRKGFHSPLRTAIRQFAIRTLARSRSHRMMLAVYAGVALALVMSSVASVAFRNNGAGLWRPGITMLSLPLIFQFLLLVGLRVIVAVPSEPKARWVFRACEPSDRGEAVSATHDVMLVTVVLPTSLFALVEGLAFWGLRGAIGHATFTLVVGALFAELLLARTAKLPFACTYFPGKSRVFTLWPIYLIVFFVYTVFLAAIETGLLVRPGSLAIFCLCAILATRLLAWYRRYSLAVLPGLLFDEEDPDAIFEGFHLSEGLAAAPKVLPNP